MARTLFIGDVHGCREELEELLDHCAYSAGNEVVLVGDLVAKGPDSLGVLALMRTLGARAVRGNHDHAVLRWHETIVQGHKPERETHHFQIARQLSPEDWRLMIGLPLWLRLPEHDALVVHGGFVPTLPLEEQSADLIMNMRTLRPDGTGSRRAEDGDLWGAHWAGPELAVFGHHALAGLQRHPHAIGLDTGCVYGGRLTAYALPEAQLYSVPSRGVYAALGSERRGRA
jgi:diadenosine tetraphosphatase ApaH/serine/threonine PP2A family protein phosphatase